MRPSWHVALVVVLGGLLTVGVARGGAAQDRPHDGRFGITLRGGLQQPHAADDLFMTMRDQLTLAPTDFRLPRLGLEVFWALTNRWEVAFGSEVGRRTARSEARESSDAGTLVAQRTRLQSSPVAVATARYYVLPSAAAIRGWTPRLYMGLGAGVTRAVLEQDGEFPDTDGAAPFTARFTSRSVGHVVALSLGGVVQRGRGPGVVVEAGYQWASAPVGADFTAFDRIDLSGLQLTLGLRQHW